MGIVYQISIIALIIAFLVIKKTDKEENILFWLFLSNIILLCYNVFECYILSFIKIKCSLALLAIINFSIVILIFLIIKKKNEKQSYYFKWGDIVIAILILLTVLGISYKRYGKNLDLKYESSDPATHYAAAKQFYKYKTLLVNVKEVDKIYEFGNFMPAAYVNTGIMFDVASTKINESQFYKVYIIFDIAILALGAEMFYFLITKDEKNSFLKIIGIVFTYLYIFAYPLNSMLFGFSYLSVSLLVIEGIVAIAPMVNSDKYKAEFVILIGFLLTFAIFFSYYLFMPIIYVALGLYLLINILKNRKEIKVFSIKNVFTIGIILIIPTVLGFCYFVLPGILSGEGTEIQSIGAEGYIYKNLYSNLILISPLILYYIIAKIRKKENDFVNIYIILSIIFILVMLVGVIEGKVSTYYFYKLYYAFWILAVFSAYKAIKEIYVNKEMRIFIYSYMAIIIGIHLYSMLDLDNKFQNKNEYLSTDNMATQITNIYSTNQNYIKDAKTYFSENQKEMLKYCEENNIFEEKQNISVCGTNLQQRWLYVIYGVTDVNNIREFATIVKKFDIKSWLDEDKKYYISFSNEENIKYDKDESKYKLLYNGTDCVLLEKIK